MPSYNFKQIHAVHDADSLVNEVLSKTQRKTPTVVKRHIQIQRIRSFYMRKVKFTQTTIDEKLGRIIEDFPKIDEIHPFYTELLSVNYRRDHYKIALGEVSKARANVGKIAKHYTALLKYAGSLFQCKRLKIAALGRMTKLLRKLDPSLQYLEQVRQHMSRLPAIDPTQRSVIIVGFTSAGKSTLLNTLTANSVECGDGVTTKTLLVGHLMVGPRRYQIIDTPGLIHSVDTADESIDTGSLDSLSTLEMSTLVALLNVARGSLVLVCIDPTANTRQQVASINSIRDALKSPDSPLCVVVTKRDQWNTWETLSQEEAKDIVSISGDIQPDTVGEKTGLLGVSAKTGQGIDMLVRAIDQLLGGDSVALDPQKDAEQKQLEANDPHMADISKLQRRLYVAVPEGYTTNNPRRPVFVPQKRDKSILSTEVAKREVERGEKNKMPMDVRDMNYFYNDRKDYILEDPEWAADKIPHIIDGHNITDFLDVDIEQKLRNLEALEAKDAMDADIDDTELMNLFNEEFNSRAVKYGKKVYSTTNTAANSDPLVRKRRRKIIEKGSKTAYVTSEVDEAPVIKKPTISKSDVREKPQQLFPQAKRVPEGTVENAVVSKKDKERSDFLRIKGIKSENDLAKAHKQDRHQLAMEMKRIRRKGVADLAVKDAKPRHLYSGKSGFKKDWK